MVIEQGILHLAEVEFPRDQVTGVSGGALGNSEPGDYERGFHSYNTGEWLPGKIEFFVKIRSARTNGETLYIQTDIPTLVGLLRFLETPIPAAKS